MPSFHELSIAQLQQAVKLREQIESLQQKFAALLKGVHATHANGRRGPKRRSGKRTVSAEARAKMAATQKARWAKAKGTFAK